MGPKVLLAAIAFMGICIASPMFLANGLQLGSYAKSPQEVQIARGSSAMVAGGRARLYYAGGKTGEDFEIRCSEETAYSTGKSATGCGVSAEHIGAAFVKGKPAGTFRIIWPAKQPPARL